MTFGVIKWFRQPIYLIYSFVRNIYQNNNFDTKRRIFVTKYKFIGGKNIQKCDPMRLKPTSWIATTFFLIVK